VLEYVFTDVQNASVFYQGDKATIYLPENNTTEECLTHELLHLFIETKEIIVCDLIEGLIREKVLLNQVLSNDLVSHMTNCINHIKMLPIFIEMGYDKKDFLADSLENKCEISFAKEINKKFRFLFIYNKSAIDLFIGKYFAIKADVSDIDYSKQLLILSETDEKLYDILDSFWTKWLKYDIEKNDSVTYWSDDFAGDFITILGDWMRKKIMI